VANVGERIIRGIGVVTVIAFIVITLTPASNAVGQRVGVTSGEIQQADAIVVLGAGVMRMGVLSDESVRRFVTGIELFKRGMAPVLVASGPGRPDAPVPTEAAVRAKLAETMGIPPAAILLVVNVNSTREESIRISRMLRDRNATRVLLVTESLHMRRSKLVFERAGLQVQPAVSDDYPAFLISPGDRLWLTMRIAQEVAGLIYYRLAGYI
jgi:uncharacterized SAM-binding protein YcdF (DUF218 family)